VLIDISPPISPQIAVWPGDVAFRRDVALSFAAGDHLELSAITSTLHVGAHADAPIHYTAHGAGIAARPLDRYYGPCQVMRVDVARGERVTPAHLPAPITAPRLLLATGTFPDPNHWNDDFASLSPELIEHAADRGVVLIGLDTPSVDPMTSKALESHHALARRDLAVLEGVVLAHVAPGTYTLIALPLRLEGADASPVRAVLVSTD
jgi:arylformamidase